MPGEVFNPSPWSGAWETVCFDQWDFSGHDANKGLTWTCTIGLIYLSSHFHPEKNILWIAADPMTMKWSEVKSVSHVRLFATPWTVTCQAPLSMGFSRQENEWVAISFSRGPSQRRDRTWVSCIVGRGFYCLSHQGSLPNDRGRHVKQTWIQLPLRVKSKWHQPGSDEFQWTTVWWMRNKCYALYC